VLAEALDPHAALAARRQEGSARPGETGRMADACRFAAGEGRRWAAAARARARAARAEEELLSAARALAAGPAEGAPARG